MTTTNELIQQALGIPVQKSPVYTAKTLLRECYRDKPHIIRDASLDLRDLPFMDAARDLVFMQELEPWMIGKHVHHFDKYWAYGSACSNVDTGVGDPVHRNEYIIPGHPGIYRVRIGKRPEDECIPIIEEGQEWVTHDVLWFALNKDYDLKIHEAWVFNDYDKVLGNRVERRNWSKIIWDAMQALKPVSKEAYEYVKTVSHVGIGSFATSKEKYGGINLIHPNWWSDVVGKTRVNMLHNIDKYGIPLLAYVDGLWYVKSDPNWRSAVPGILDRMDKLGGYRHEGSFVLTEELYAQANALSAGEMVTLFKNAAGEK